MRVIVETFLVINIIFLTACYRWRWLAKYQIYFVILDRICFAFIPSDEMRGLHPFIFCTNGALLIILTYCGSLLSVYTLIATVYFEMIFVVYYAYDRPIGLADLAMVTSYAIVVMMLILGVAAIIEHVSSLYHRLSSTAVENLKLLNAMHEGLIIFRKPKTMMNGERTPMFCNKSAYKVIKKLGVSTKDCSLSEAVALAQMKKAFVPVKNES